MQESGGVLLLNKPEGWTSHDCVAWVRRRVGVAKVGHAGTLDPFATGVLVVLVGRQWTTSAPQMQAWDKSYRMRVRLGVQTDSFDRTGQETGVDPYQPSLAELEATLHHFQGAVLQIPPMFSAKKVGGRKLYQLARQGKEVERLPVQVHLQTRLLSYSYPHCELEVDCSKGTYLRSIAAELGDRLGCGAHAEELVRTRVGPFALEECWSIEALGQEEDFGPLLLQPALEATGAS